MATVSDSGRVVGLAPGSAFVRAAARETRPFLGDTWAFDGATWTLLTKDGPPARAMGYLAYDAKRDRIVLFGGRNGWPDGDLGDTWEFDGTRWQQWHDASASSAARNAALPSGDASPRLRLRSALRNRVSFIDEDTR